MLPSIINAALLTAAFSCGMAVTVLASRVLFGLAEEGQAPRIFLKTNRFGAPYLAVAASCAFLFLVYLSLGSNSSVAFGWFVHIATVAAFISWIVIEVTYLRFYYGLKAQGISRDRKFFDPNSVRVLIWTGLPYKSPLQPYMTWATLVALIIITLTSGYEVFIHGRWNTSSFLTSYIGIPIFLGERSSNDLRPV